jgi:single-strand DNA-binding protein
LIINDKNKYKRLQTDITRLQIGKYRVRFGGHLTFASVKRQFIYQTMKHFNKQIFIIMTTLRNNVQLIGRLGNEPEVRTFESGKKMATFTLATSEVYYNNQGEKVEETQWHNIVVWGKKVDVVESYVKKGQEIAVQGKIQTRSYEKEGEKRYMTEINLNELLLLGKKA